MGWFTRESPSLEIGQRVKLIGGSWKGHRGVVVEIDEIAEQSRLFLVLLEPGKGISAGLKVGASEGQLKPVK